MNCPNILHPDWKKLVEVEGEISARNLFIKNNFKIPTLDEVSELKNSMVENPISIEDSRRLKEIIDLKTKALLTMTTRYNIYKNKIQHGDGKESLKEIVKSLEESIHNFEKADIRESVATILENINFTLHALENRLKKGLTIAGLNQAKDIANSFDILDDLSEFLVKANYFEKEESKKSKEYIKSLTNRISELNTIYNEKAKLQISELLANHSNIKRFERKTQLEKEYKLNNPFEKSILSRKDYNNNMTKWINAKLLSENAKILVSEQEYILSLLDTAPGDITTLSANLVDPRNITQDQILQVLVGLLDKATFSINQEFMEKKDKMSKEFEKLTKGLPSIGITDQQKLYGDILERDRSGNLTGYITRPISNQYYDAWSKTTKLASEFDEGSDRKQVYKDFFKKYKNPTPKELLKKGNEEKLKEWNDSIDSIKEEYLSEQYKALKNDPVRFEFYEYLVSLNKEADIAVKRSGRQLGYKLPSITKKTNEILKEKGIKAALKQYYKDELKLQADDWQYGELDGENDTIKILSTSGGKQYRSINIPFRNNIDIADQSLDVAGMALSNLYASLNFKYKYEIKDLLELSRDLIAERNVEILDKSSLKKIVQVVKRTLNISKEEENEIQQRHLKKGSESNSYKLLNSIIEDRLYGISNIAGGELLGLSIDKISNAAMKVSAHNFLIANWIGGASNVLQGKVMNFLGGVAGIEYNRKNLRNGEKNYINDLKNNIEDINEISPKSRTNVLLNVLLGDSIGFDGFINNLTQDSKIKRFASVKNLHAINNIAEHYIQGTLMYAVLDNLKIKNINGEYIDKAGQVVDSRDNAANINDFIKIENGKINFSSEIIVEGFENYKNDSDILFHVSRKIKDVVSDAQGNYSNENKSMIQRYWWGKLIMFMRKFLVRSTQKRWKGLAYSKWEKENLPLHLQGFSESLQKDKEGTYVTLIRFLRKLKEHNQRLSLELLSNKWNNLSDYERGNIKSAIMEMGIMISALIASSLLASLAEDEDEESIWFAAYLNRRLWGELSFFTPIGIVSTESTRLLESPTATLSTMKTFGRFIDSSINDIVSLEFKEFESGHRSGQYKSWVHFNRLVNPFYKQTVDISHEDRYKLMTQTY